MGTTTLSARINFRTDEKTKKEAEELFCSLGIDMSTALNMFLKQAIREQALPIRPALRYVPTPQTQEVLDHVSSIVNGSIRDDGVAFANADEAAHFLDHHLQRGCS